MAGSAGPTIPEGAEAPSGRLFAEVQEPLRRALERLTPLFDDIEADWRGMLARIATRPGERDSLLALALYLEQCRRRRLAQDLHDEFGSLAVLKCSLEQTAASLKRGRTRQAGRRLEETAALVTDTIESVRRVILDLAPAVLDELDLPRAMRLAARQFAARTGIEVALRTRGVPDRLPHGHETALYRVLQGALSNVLRHSRARRATVTLAVAPGPTVVMVVTDRGVGFAPRARGAAGSFGLDAMRERVEDLGGRLTVQSSPARDRGRRRGTRIEVRLPLPAGAR